MNEEIFIDASQKELDNLAEIFYTDDSSLICDKIKEQ